MMIGVVRFDDDCMVQAVMLAHLIFLVYCCKPVVTFCVSWSTL